MTANSESHTDFFVTAHLVQREKSQPEGKRIMLETRFTEFLALSADPKVGISQSAPETAD